LFGFVDNGGVDLQVAVAELVLAALGDGRAGEAEASE
jgi:hypothetical protein